MVNIKETLYGAERYLNSVGYEDVDIYEIDVDISREWEGCCELCMSEVDVYVIKYDGKEFRVNYL